MELLIAGVVFQQDGERARDSKRGRERERESMSVRDRAEKVSTKMSIYYFFT